MLGFLRRLITKLAQPIDPATVETDSAPGRDASAPPPRAADVLTVHNADGTVWHMPIPPTSPAHVESRTDRENAE